MIGTGLIGGSVGLALKKRRPDVTVVAFDRDPASSARAKARGAADEIVDDPSSAVLGADIVILATPVRSIAGIVSEVAPSLSPGAVLTDVGSTKARLVAEVETSLPEGVTFIGGHPMAGAAEDGIEAATSDLFDGAWWVLTPTTSSDAADYRRLHGLLTTLGARVMALAPEEHDELMAIISHVPQLTATALMTQAATRGEDHAGLLALAAGGFRDVTRIAASNPEIWLDICEENAAAISSALTHFAERLEGLRDLVERQDREGLRLVFLAAREARRNLPHKAVEGDLFEVTMPVPDRPGVLAEVTTTIGNLGVNIEDLGISHATEGGRGVLTLAITGRAEAERAASVLVELGYDAKAHPV